MAQTPTAALNIEKARDGQEPVLLLILELSGETLYLSNRAITVDGQAYTELLSAGIAVEQSGRFDARGGSDPPVGNVRIALANEDDVAGTPFSDVLATRILTNRRAVLRQEYINAAGAPLALADTLPVIDGRILLPDSSLFTDTEFQVEIIDGSQAWHEDLGIPIIAADWPYAPDEAIGRIEPIIYGAIPKSPCIPVDIGARSTLRSDLTAAATTIPVTDAAHFPSNGTVVIDEEEIAYTGKSGNDLTGGTRGAGAISHTQAAAALEKLAEYVWRIADHPLKAVSAAYVRRRGGTQEDWVRLNPSDYIIDEDIPM